MWFALIHDGHPSAEIQLVPQQVQGLLHQCIGVMGRGAAAGDVNSGWCESQLDSPTSWSNDVQSWLDFPTKGKDTIVSINNTIGKQQSRSTNCFQQQNKRWHLGYQQWTQLKSFSFKTCVWSRINSQHQTDMKSIHIITEAGNAEARCHNDAWTQKYIGLFPKRCWTCCFDRCLLHVAGQNGNHHPFALFVPMWEIAKTTFLTQANNPLINKRVSAARY